MIGKRIPLLSLVLGPAIVFGAGCGSEVSPESQRLTSARESRPEPAEDVALPAGWPTEILLPQDPELERTVAQIDGEPGNEIYLLVYEGWLADFNPVYFPYTELLEADGWSIDPSFEDPGNAHRWVKGDLTIDIRGTVDGRASIFYFTTFRG